MIGPEEVLGLLSAVDAGLLEVAPPKGECTSVIYEVGKLKFTVFDDAGSWDYIESLTLPSGERLAYSAEESTWDRVFEWRPRSGETLDKVWHFWKASEYQP